MEEGEENTERKKGSKSKSSDKAKSAVSVSTEAQASVDHAVDSAELEKDKEAVKSGKGDDTVMPKKTLAGSSKEAVIKTDWSALGVTDQTVAEVDRLIKDEKSGGYSRHTLMMDAGLRRKLEGDLTNLTSRSAQQSGSQDSTFGTDNADVTELFARESKDDAEGMTPDPELTPVSIKKKLSQRLEDLDNWTHTKKASEQDRRDGEAMVQHINQCMNIVMDCAIELNDRTDNKIGKQIDHLSTVYNAQIMEVAKLQKRQFADLSAAVKHESQGVRNETALSLAQMNQRIGGVESGGNEIKKHST